MTNPWPPLPFEAWKDTCATLHMWTQIVGKIRLVQTPWVNHSWHVPLYLTARGLTTSPIRYDPRVFQIDFDFIDHKLLIQADDGPVKTMALQPRSVADFYQNLFAQLAELDIDVKINTTPNEVADAITFEHDQQHRSYDAEYANRFWRTLLQADRVLKEFRARFKGKCSPVHFFWGGFDLAVTRFSGRPAPERADPIQREGYSHEVISAGFWPGGGAVTNAAFYAYAAPEPAGFKTESIRPAAASYDNELGLFLLLYEDMRTASSPR